MKFLSLLLFVSSMFIGTSCKKETTTQMPGNITTMRRVQFVLYTDGDFATDNDTIRFSLSIKKATNQILWDSALAPMRIKDIPDFVHKIAVEKFVPGNDTSLLKVGFYYTIDNVGNSWFTDSFNSGDSLKTVNFNFH